MIDIFISYARTTEASAQTMAGALRALGYDVWRDDELPAHRAYGDVIEERVHDAKVVVVVWSAEAVKSHWVRSEADRARIGGKLVQLRIDGVKLPMPFDQIQCAEMQGWSGDLAAPGWIKVVSSIADLLDGASLPLVEAPALALPDKPSIAVLPFANLSDTADQDYFVDGLMEEIVTSLSRIRTLFVIASGSSLSLKGRDMSPLDAARRLGVRYILEGSVRRAGGRVRIAVKLVDATGGAQIWADRFEDTLADVFALQDRVALSVAGVIEFSVQSAETRHSTLRPVVDLRSYDLYLQALLLVRTYAKPDIYQALALLDRAVKLEPNYALALSLAAGCHVIIMQFRWSDDPHDHRARFNDLIDRSLRVGSDDPQVLANAAMAYWTIGDFAAAARLATRATTLNPGSSWPWLVRGQTAVAVGDLDVGVDCLERSMRLDPLSPNRNLQLGAMTMARFAQRQYADAANLGAEWVQLTQNPRSLALMAAIYGQLDQPRAARDTLARLQSIFPRPAEEMAVALYQSDAHRALFLQGLERAQSPAPDRPRQTASFDADGIDTAKSPASL